MRFHDVGEDGHTLKVKSGGQDESVPAISYRKSASVGFTECFGIGEGYIRLRNVSTASLPSSPDDGAMVFNTTENEAQIYNGSAWVPVGGTSITYATGTWTPNIQDSSLSDGEGQAVTAANCRYTRIGDRVFISGEISITNLGTLSGSLVYVSGLPLTAANDGGALRVTSMNNATVAHFPTGIIDGGTTALLVYPDGFGDFSYVGISDFNTSTTFKFTGQYRTTA